MSRRPPSKKPLGNLFVALAVMCASGASAFESGRADFFVRVNDEHIPYDVFAIFALPGELLEVEVMGGTESPYRLIADTRVQAQGPRLWAWTAPGEPGLYQMTVVGSTGEVKLNVFVMHPASALDGARLGEYRVGRYPETPLNDNPIYLAPDGFIELNERTAAVQVSPHFTLSQFPSKQAGGYPKYLVLTERLLLKLELLLEQLNADGIAAETLTIMSGYRTPFYNRAIGNVPYSRHVYGGAADIYVDDSPRDDVMDDINRDGRLDFRDAQMLYRIADRLFARPEYRWLVGGLGVYRRTPAHGPFVHIDARGFRSRWGLIPEGAQR